MSYENPKVIVDRSGEIAGQAIANFGSNISRGLDNFYAKRAKGLEQKRKSDEADALAISQASLDNIDRINKISGKIPNKSLSDQTRDEFTNRYNTSEGNIVMMGDKEFSASVADATVGVKNPDIDKDTKNAYLKIISNYRADMQAAPGLFAGVTVDTEQIKTTTDGVLNKDYVIAGNRGEQKRNLLSVMSLQNQKMDGVSSVKTSERKHIGGGVYSKILTIKSKVNKDSQIYKNWKTNNQLTNEDEDGNEIEAFIQDPDDPNSVICTSTLNMDEIGEDGTGLVIKISPDKNSLEALEAAGYFEQDKGETGKGFVANPITHDRTLENGDKVTATEKHFDLEAFKSDKTVNDIYLSKAAGILRLPLNQQVKHMQHVLGWGDEITEKKWASDSFTDEERTSFITQSLQEDDILKLTGAKNMNDLKTRKAEQSDVDAYGSNESLNPIQVGQDITFIETKVARDIKRESTKKVDTDKFTSKQYFELFKDPKQALSVAGINGDFDEENNIVTVEKLTGDTRIVEQEDGSEVKEKITETITLDLNKESDYQSYINSMISNTPSLNTASNRDKAFAIKRMVKGFQAKKKKDSDNFFSKQASKAIKTGKATTGGPLDNLY